MTRRVPLLSEFQADHANGYVNRLAPEQRPVFWEALIRRLSPHPSDAEVGRCSSQDESKVKAGLSVWRLIFDELRRGEHLARRA
jgi:hypothetical protein